MPCLNPCMHAGLTQRPPAPCTQPTPRVPRREERRRMDAWMHRSTTTSSLDPTDVFRHIGPSRFQSSRSTGASRARQADPKLGAVPLLTNRGARFNQGSSHRIQRPCTLIARLAPKCLRGGPPLGGCWLRPDTRSELLLYPARLAGRRWRRRRAPFTRPCGSPHLHLYASIDGTPVRVNEGHCISNPIWKSE